MLIRAGSSFEQEVRQREGEGQRRVYKKKIQNGKIARVFHIYNHWKPMLSHKRGIRDGEGSWLCVRVTSGRHGSLRVGVQ